MSTISILTIVCFVGETVRKKCKHCLCVFYAVLSSKPLSLDAREGFVYLHVFALDVESFDLLRELDTCVQFIDSGRKAGAVLVHW